jgi:hypothetical protein
MLNVSTFGNTSDIYAIVHLVPHACQRITVDPSHSSGDTVTEILEISGEWRHKDNVLHKPPEDTLSICEICLKKLWEFLSIGVRITMICCVVYLLRIFKIFHGLMNNSVLYTCIIDNDAVCHQFCLTCTMNVSHLKDKALDRTMWRTCFRRVFGPVVRQTATWMNIISYCRNRKKVMSQVAPQNKIFFTSEPIVWYVNKFR